MESLKSMKKFSEVCDRCKSVSYFQIVTTDEQAEHICTDHDGHCWRCGERLRVEQIAGVQRVLSTPRIEIHPAQPTVFGNRVGD